MMGLTTRVTRFLHNNHHLSEIMSLKVQLSCYNIEGVDS
jgi:hypothetical protein